MSLMGLIQLLIAKLPYYVAADRVSLSSQYVSVGLKTMSLFFVSVSYREKSLL